MVINQEQSARIDPDILEEVMLGLEIIVEKEPIRRRHIFEPCFVYIPVDSQNGEGPTHVLDLNKTKADSPGWSKRELGDYMTAHNTRTTYP